MTNLLLFVPSGSSGKYKLQKILRHNGSNRDWLFQFLVVFLAEHPDTESFGLELALQALKKNVAIMTIDEIFENNRNWLNEKKRSNPDFFKHLAAGQHPDFLFIGCSDSRVTAEDLMGAQPGEVFVHRNVANLVPNNDNSSASVIEYAIGHLGVKHVIVCGHYFCGGVKAAMESKDLGILNPWLRTIRDVYRLHRKELNCIDDEDARYNRLVELNVQEQCVNIIKMAVWQKSYLKDKSPIVHGWVFDVQSGELIDLKINWQKIALEIREIYDLSPDV